MARARVSWWDAGVSAHWWHIFKLVSHILYIMMGFILKDKYPNFEVGLKYILRVFLYQLSSSYMNENAT